MRNDGSPPERAEALPELDEEALSLAAVEPGLEREIRRLALFLAVACAAFALVYFTPLAAIVRDVEHIRAYLAGDDLLAELSFVGLVALFVAVGVPRLMFYGVAGLAFGFWPGLLLAQTGALLGSWLSFFAIRHGGRGWLHQRFGAHRLFKKAFRVRSSVKAVALVRQLPLHGLMITAALALSEVRTRTFLLGSFLGFLPQGAIATLIGSGLVAAEAMSGFMQLFIAAAALLLAVAWLKRWRKT